MIATFVGFITFKSDVASATIIHVGIGLGNDSATINGGIALADPGDTVYVYNGIYYENVEVNKTINLIGEDWFRTIINGSGSGDVVNVTADFVNISGFTVTNGEIGISISSSNNTITGNNVTSNKRYGIHLSFSDNNTLTDNTVSLYDANAFYLFYSDNNIFTNNNIYNFVPIIYDSSGFALVYSTHNTITANNIYLNHEGIQLCSYSNWNNIIANTLFRNVVGIHLSNYCNWNNIIANNIMKNWWGLYIIVSIENIITNNYISSNNEYGIYLTTSSDNTIITDNIISSNNDDGILLSSSSNNNITANVISDNLEGINVSSLSNNNIIIGNNVSNNSYGIHIEDSLNNSIYHNNIINNTNQAYDDTNNGNEWDNGYPSGGNYWSDFDEPGEGAFDGYKGPDQNVFGSDDIVDLGPPIGGKNPYIIDGDSQDNYPLIKFVKYLFLYEGWNLISIPFIQPETNLGIVLNSIKGSYDAVQWYNVSDNSDPWKHNSTKKPSHLNDLDDIHHKMGFWIHITQPGGVLFQYFGVPPKENQSITLHPGWNLVGYPSLVSYNRTQGLNNITFGTDVDSIWTYNAATQKWEGIEESDYFDIGRGYWVHSKVERNWEIPLK